MQAKMIADRMNLLFIGLNLPSFQNSLITATFSAQFTSDTNSPPPPVRPAAGSTAIAFIGASHPSGTQ